MPKLTTHFLCVAEDGISDEAGHIGWKFALQAEDPGEVVRINNQICQRDAEHDYVAMCVLRTALEVVKCDAEGEDIEDVNRRSANRIEELIVLALL